MVLYGIVAMRWPKSRAIILVLSVIVSLGAIRAVELQAAPLLPTPSIHIRKIDQQIQLGTESDRAYYVQWRSPTTGWQTWTSGSTIPEGIDGVWFRAIFDSNPEDPTEWELAEDVDRILMTGDGSQRHHLVLRYLFYIRQPGLLRKTAVP